MRWTASRAVGGLVFVSALLGCEDRRAVPTGAWDGWASGEPPARVALRVATWNVEGLSMADTPGFDAAVDVLLRLDADVVALNEVAQDEADALDALAAALGHDQVALDGDPAFGNLRNAVMARVPVVDAVVHDGASLQGPGTVDLTRGVVTMRVRVPGTEREVGVASLHLKSGFEPADAFRRAVDGVRVMQAAATLDSSDLALVLGDVNSEPGQRYEPATFGEAPEGLPEAWEAGADIQD